VAKPGVRFAEALRFLRKLNNGGVVGIHTTEIPNRYYRQILLKNGFLRTVTKGWYIAVHPDEKENECTAWYSGYWEFCAKFLNHKYGDDWCLSANQSLLLHAGSRLIPQQLMVDTSRGNNLPTTLLHNTSVFNRRALMPSAEQIGTENGIRMYTLPSALVYCSSGIYVTNALDVRTALSLIKDSSEILTVLLENGHSTLAGRLAGAFRNIKRHEIADQIMTAFMRAGYDVRENDPFKTKPEIRLPAAQRSPYVNRIRLMWSGMRGIILKDFGETPGIPDHYQEYMKGVDELYVTDAYHSLSLAGYRVTPELLAKVSDGGWIDKRNGNVGKRRNAVAARGYYLAFRRVSKTIVAILNGSNAGYQTGIDHSEWYRALFDPRVTAGLCKASDLAGYRHRPVYIGQSNVMPFNADAMGEVMPVLFGLLFEEPEACVRAVLGHFMFELIHPYMEGNGRMGRLLMNTMLASGGYPWTVIPVTMKTAYRQSLERARTEKDIRSFSKLVASLVNQSIRGKALAVPSVLK
jgi:hypothetical protein